MRADSQLHDAASSQQQQQQQQRFKTAPLALQVCRDATSGALRVTPSELHFKDVTSGLQFVATLAVQNASTTSVKRVRIVPPQSKLFSLNYTPVLGVAPGLEVTAEVTFQLEHGVSPPSQTVTESGVTAADTSLTEYTDKLVISCGEDTIVVPLIARPPCAELQYTEFINFGAVAEGQRAELPLTITNTGSRSGKYRINYDTSLPITITPREGFLSAGRSYVYDSDSTEALSTSSNSTNSAVVTIEFDAVRWQQLQQQALQVPFRCIATLECDGCLNSNSNSASSAQFKRIIDISAAVQQQKLQLLGGEGGPLSDLNFGELYFGGKREIVASLFNRGPTAATFTAAIDCITDVNGSSGGDDTLSKCSVVYRCSHNIVGQCGSTDACADAADKSTATLSTTATNTDNGNTKSSSKKQKPKFSITPKDGCIQPGCSQLLRIQFTPTLPVPVKGFRTAATAAATALAEFTAKLSVENVELKEDSFGLSLKGRAAQCAVTVSQSVLRFGDCACADRRDILITVTNPGPLNCKYALEAPANFSCTPRTGTIGGESQAKIVISFVPHQLGAFKDTVVFVLENGTAVREIRVIGNCIAASTITGVTGTAVADTAATAPTGSTDGVTAKFKFVKSQAAADVRLAATIAKLHPWQFARALFGQYSWAYIPSTHCSTINATQLSV
eukprot:3530-Heterococcus_DN1.PRE.3